LLALLAGWGVGAAGYALVVQPVWGDHLSDFFALPPVGMALSSGFFVGLIAVQITQAARRSRRVPWGALAGSLLGLVAAAVLGFVLASPLMKDVYTLFLGLAGALFGGLIAGGGRR
jgi:hypothetical protein